MNLSGQVRPTRTTPRLYNSTIEDVGSISNGMYGEYVYDTGMKFMCTSPNNSTMSLPEWRTTICQLGSSNGPGNDSYSGSPVSGFKNLTTWNQEQWQVKFGTAYLVLNITSGLADDWAKAPQGTEGVSPHSSRERGEWLDLAYDYGSLTLSVTLCYSGFSTADLQIDMSSNEKSNRAISSL